MEGEIVNQFPLIFGSTSFERSEPVMNPFLGQAFAALRQKDIRSISISTRFEILIEGLSSLVHEIDIAPLATFVAHMQPPNFRTNMRMGHLQPGNITNSAPSPITQRENGSSAPVFCLLD